VTARISSLDGLRGIAATGIMLFHFNYFYLPQAGLFDIAPGLRRAYLGVDLFFLLSGFVMAHVYGGRLASNRRLNWREFARVRVARIYPLLFLTTVTLVAAHAAFDLPVEGVSFTLRSLALQPLLMQVWAKGLSWNYPGWSISTEAAAYVLFVFSAAPLLRGRHPWWVALACIAVLIGISAGQHGVLHLYRGLPALLRTLAEFTLGALLYRVHASGVSISGGRLALIAGACLLLAAQSGWDVFLVGELGCLMLYGAHAESALARILASRPAVALGAWSYSIYLWHVPTHYTVMGAFAAAGHPVAGLSPTSSRVLFAVTVMAVIALSAASFTYFERPMRRLIRRWLVPTVGSVTASAT
jgi:peptidoglycan/LPS O-acetylase OafA/YrhL